MQFAVDGSAGTGAALALWLAPEELGGLGEGDRVRLWPPAPGAAGPAIAGGTASTYRVDAGTGKGGVLIDTRIPGTFDGGFFDFPPAVVGDWSLYVVGRTLIADTHGPAVFDRASGTGLLLVSEGGVYATDPEGVTVVNDGAPPALGDLHFYGSKRQGDRWEIWRDGVLLASATGPDAPVTVNRLAVFYGAPPGGGAWIPEVRLFAEYLDGAADAAQWSYLAVKYEEDGPMRPGTFAWFATPTARDGYLLQDGAEYPIAVYPALYADIGDTFKNHRGAADPAAGNFRVPNNVGLRLVCGGGATSNPTTTAKATGTTGGKEAVSLTESQLAPHSHGVTDPGHNHILASSLVMAVRQLKGASEGTALSFNTGLAFNSNPIATAATGVTVDSAGAGDPVPVEDPYAVAYLFIKT